MTPGRPATFVISIDVEMSWGAVHHGAPHDPRPYEQEREVVARTLDLMRRHGISATWAIVGHLFLSECTATGGRPHPEIVRPDYPWLGGDWYDLDPVSDLAAAPTWYGPDLVARIRACDVPQEIGSHSFGHVIAGDPGCSADAFRSDLDAARSLAETEGVELRSFVYPRNSVGHLDLLAAAGFTAFRSPTPDRFAGMPPWRRRLASLADSVRPLPTATFSPVVRGPLVDIPQTYLFDPCSKRARRLGTTGWTMAVRRRLRHAVRTSSLFHLWFHSHNLAGDPERAWRAMDALLAEARRHIDAGRLENLTMGAVAERWRGSDATPT
jgi:peptidoglycan/xylan/chitin deacetylase (PgdA/CDA1 family)